MIKTYLKECPYVGIPSKIFSLGIPFEIQYCMEELIFKYWKYPDSLREENKGEFGPVNGKYHWYE